MKIDVTKPLKFKDSNNKNKVEFLRMINLENDFPYKILCIVTYHNEMQGAMTFKLDGTSSNNKEDIINIPEEPSHPLLDITKPVYDCFGKRAFYKEISPYEEEYSYIYFIKKMDRLSEYYVSIRVNKYGQYELDSDRFLKNI